MELVIPLLTVFGLGIIELWVAIPVGLVLGVPPIATGIVSIVGAMFGVLLVAMLGERLRTWLMQRYGGNIKDGQRSRIYRIWASYGVVGLGLLAPLLVGAPLGTALGIIFDASRRRLLFWITIGIILWGAGLTFAGALGLVAIEGLIH